MAKIKDNLIPKISGKLNKKDDKVYRVRNGKQQAYSPAKNAKDPSPAQNEHRRFFGKVNTLVNAIMADPKQTAEWQLRMDEYHHSIALNMQAKRYKTLRAFIFAEISTQLAQNKAIKRRRRGIQKALPRGIKLHIKPFAELSTTELYEILKSRFSVFYTEQGCRYLDMDDIDYIAIHLALFRKGHVIAYARLFKGKEPDTWHIGRMLTTERGIGFGKYILEQTILEAERQGAQTILLHAQTHAVAFYESFGFKQVGDVFMEADIPHVCMRRG